MAYSHNYGRGRGRGGPAPPYGGRDRDFSPGNHRYPPAQNNQQRQHQPNFTNTMRLISGDDHDRMIRGDRKRPGSPPRQQSPSQKRPVYDSRADNQFDRYGNGAQEGPRGHPGPMDFGYGQENFQRGDRQFSNMQDSRGQMNPGGDSQLPLPPSNQAPLFPASVPTPGGQSAPKPLKSILKKKTPAPEPTSQSTQPEPPSRAPERSAAQQQGRGYDKARLPGMSSYLEPEDEDRFLYGEDVGKQINAAMQRASNQGEMGLGGSGSWMHPSDLGRMPQQNVPVSTSFSGNSGLVQTNPGGITALSDESMSTIQAALASLKQTQAPPSSQLFPAAQSRQTDVLSALPNISNDLLSSLKLPSNLLSGFGIPQQQQSSRNPQIDLLSNLSSSQTSELLSTVNQLKATMGRQSADSMPHASQLSESLLMSRIGAQQSTPIRDEPKKDETTNTIQNILQSIGFDFGMSKRMQELAREKEERECKVKEKDICINQSASFLGGGLSGADLTAGLFKRKDSQPRQQKSESRESRKPEEKETGQKIESVLSSKRDSIESKPPEVSQYDPYLHGGAYPPIQSYPGIPIHPNQHGYPPQGFPPGYPPPGGFFDIPPQQVLPHHTGSERRESDHFDDYDDFDKSMNKRSRRDSRSSERSRSRSIRRGSSDRSPRRRRSLERSPRVKSPGRGRSKSPNRRSRDSPKRRISPSPKRKRSLSPKRRGSRDRSPRRRDSKERRSSKDRDRRRTSKDRDRRPSSKDRGTRRSSRDRDRRPSSKDRDKVPRERRPSSKDRERRPSSKEKDKHSASKERERRGSSRDRRVTSESVPPKTESRDSSKEKSSRNDSVDKKLPEDFKIQIGTNADSRRVLASKNIFEQPPPRQPSQESTRIVLMPKAEQHIRKITVAPKSKEESPRSKPIPTDLPQEVKAKLKQEHDERQKKLDNLEKEMEKLKKQQNEIMRKRQRQKDGHKDPLLTANSKLQEEITEQIRALRRAAEEPVDVKRYQKPDVKVEPKGAEVKGNNKTLPNNKNYKFVDHRSHWCRCCNVVSNNILQMCKHLKSRPHQQKVDPYDRPWTLHSMKKNSENNSKGPVTNLPLSGTEFVMSVDAFYCSLCNEFMGDIPSAEAHLNDISHYNMYKAYLTKNPFYEKRYVLEKTAKLSIKKEERDQEQRKEMDKTRQSNREKDAKIKEKEKRWNKDVKDLSDNQPQERQKKPDSADIKLKLAGKKEEDKQYGKFTWKKEGKGVVNTAAKLVADEEEIPLPPASSTTVFPKPKLFLPDASEQHFPAPKVTTKEAEPAIPSRGKAKKGNRGATNKDAPPVVIPTVIGRIPRGDSKKATVLPSWTPVTRKIPGSSSKVLPIPKSEQQSKTQAENPVSLDEFLSTGEDKDKAVPVVPGPDINLLSIPLPPSMPSAAEIQEEKEDLKLLGIDPESRAPLATPIAPPPVSQNLNLPDNKKSNIMSATTASNMYGIYFDSKQNAEAAATNENNINVEAENSKLKEARDNMDVVAMDVDSPAQDEANATPKDSEKDTVKDSATEKNLDKLNDKATAQEKSDTSKSLEVDVQEKAIAEVKAITVNADSNTEQESKTEDVQNEKSDPKEQSSVAKDSSEAEAVSEDPTLVNLEAKGNSFDENADGNEDSNDSTIIMSLDHDNFMEGMTVIDDDDEHSDMDHMEGMTVIDEHNDDDTVGDVVATDEDAVGDILATDEDNVGDIVATDEDIVGVILTTNDAEQGLLRGDIADKEINETDLADALDQFTGAEEPSDILIPIDYEGEDTNPEIISLPVEDSLQDILGVEGGVAEAIPEDVIVTGVDDALPVVAVDNIEDSLPESIPVEGGDNLGLSVSLIENFSEESDSSKCFDPCLADSVADETVSFVDGISVLEPSDPVEAEDTICPEEFKGISLEMEAEQDDLDISDGQSLGSSIDMGSDFEVLDECEDEADIADG